MSVVNRILYEDPDMFYVLNGAAPYVDRSRRRAGNISPGGTRVMVSPLRGLSESLNSTTLGSVTLHKVPRKEHTLFAWVKQTQSLQTHILSFFGGETEGLVQNGNQMKFGIRHVGGAFTTATAEIDGSRGHLFFGVYDGSRVSLYCDGVEVAYTNVTNPAPVDLDATLNYGEPSGAALGMFGVFMRPLSGASIANIQQAANRVDLRTAVLSAYNATDLRMQQQISDYNTFVFDENSPSLVSSVAVAGTTVSATYDSTLTSIAGSVRFAAPFVDSNNGFRVSWSDSVGATVKYSFDGTTYSPLYNGQTVAAGASVPDQPMFEVSFPAASTSNMYLKDLKVDKVISTTLVPAMSNGRAVTTTGSVSLSDDWDFRNYSSLPSTFGTNGTIVIAPETEDNTIMTYAIEFWYTPVAADLTGTKTLLNSNPEHATNITFTNGLMTYNGFTTVTINKVSTGSGTYTLVPGVPVHIVGLYTTQNNAQIRLGAASNPVGGKLSSVALIRTYIVGQPEINIMFDLVQDVPLSALASNSGVTLTDTAVTTYALVWTGGAQ